MVEPMILIPLLENSFKHSGIGFNEDAFIIFMLAAENGFLTARCHNSKQTLTVMEKEEDGGIGLSAIEKRLAIKYPDNHQLAIHEDENNFYVHLSIPFA
jgi:LytS/YehU family sensor histidine kinase